MSTAHPLRVLLPLTALLLGACASPDDVTRVDTSSQGTLVANTRPEGGGRLGAAVEMTGDPEGILRKGGRLYYVKDRGATLLRGPQRVTNGLRLERNGEVMLEDGRRVQLREGYMVTQGGDVIEAPLYFR